VTYTFAVTGSDALGIIGNKTLRVCVLSTQSLPEDESRGWHGVDDCKVVLGQNQCPKSTCNFVGTGTDKHVCLCDEFELKFEGTPLTSTGRDICELAGKPSVD